MSGAICNICTARISYCMHGLTASKLMVVATLLLIHYYKTYMQQIMASYTDIYKLLMQINNSMHRTIY